MVNARLYKTARLAFLFVSLRHVDFLDCATKTSKCFECETGAFTHILKILVPDLVESHTALSQFCRRQQINSLPQWVKKIHRELS